MNPTDVVTEGFDIVSTSRENLEKFIRELHSLASYVKILQVSGYPSDGQAANVSKETTTKELLAVEGIPQPVFMAQNINLFFGKVNNVEYCQKMHNAPSLYKLREDVLRYKKEKRYVA